MKLVSELIYRQITPADFYNINKPSNVEASGGGQSYIDIPTGSVEISTWHSFFDEIQVNNTQSGPLWKVELHSLGGLGSQVVDIGQRRPQSVNIRSQKIHSTHSNRVYAWLPKNGFPRLPSNINSARDARVQELTAGVRIFILKTNEKEYWAGWFKTEEINRLSDIDSRFNAMLEHQAGYITFKPEINLDETDLNYPIVLQPTTKPSGETKDDSEEIAPKKQLTYNDIANRTEEEIATELFHEDTLDENVIKQEIVRNVFERNRRSTNALKQLYKSCQITGDRYVFQKTNGEPYLEVHHLVPLGEGGSNNPANLVVVSAHIHRMLHYASVEGIELSKITNGKLDFQINDEEFTISWHPRHEQVVKRASGATS